MQPLKCILASILSISLASVILVLFCSPQVYGIGDKTPQIDKNASNIPYHEKTIKTPYGSISAQISTSSQESVENYVLEQAKAENVSTTIVKWIVGKESHFGQRLVGDDATSLGPWQFNLVQTPSISESCAMDLKCSTSLALAWLRAGKENKWSSWKYRCLWYSKENPPDCK